MEKAQVEFESQTNGILICGYFSYYSGGPEQAIQSFHASIFSSREWSCAYFTEIKIINKFVKHSTMLDLQYHYSPPNCFSVVSYNYRTENLSLWSFLLSRAKGREQRKGNPEESEYLSPWLLWATETQRSWAVCLDPECVIVCLWSHKKPTEPCSGTQRNRESGESKQGRGHWANIEQPLCFAHYGNNKKKKTDS